MLLSGLIVNLTHGYLLWSQRHDRKWAISAHAANDTRSYITYLIAHLSSAFLYLLFANEVFVQKFDVHWLFVASIITVSFQILQAVIPSRGKTIVLHGVLAYGMWTSHLIVGYGALVSLPLSNTIRYLALPLLICPVLLGIYAYFNKQKMYWLQMIVIGSYCLGMVVIASA